MLSKGRRAERSRSGKAPDTICLLQENPMDADESSLNEELLAFFKALSDADRLKILGLLAVEPRTVGQVAGLLHLKPSNAMRQLDRLKEIEIICEQDGFYRLDTASLEVRSRRLLSGLRPSVDLEDFEGEDYDRKVLNDFLLPDGSLMSIPVQHKKLMVVLRYIVQAFEPGERYPEKHVNVILRRYSTDAASLRRYLVDEGFMQRSSGIYWRVDGEDVGLDLT